MPHCVAGRSRARIATCAVRTRKPKRWPDHRLEDRHVDARYRDAGSPGADEIRGRGLRRVGRGLDPVRRDHVGARRHLERDLGDRRDRRLELLRQRSEVHPQQPQHVGLGDGDPGSRTDPRGLLGLERQPVRPLVRHRDSGPELDRRPDVAPGLPLLVAGHLRGRRPGHLRPRRLRRPAPGALTRARTTMREAAVAAEKSSSERALRWADWQPSTPYTIGLEEEVMLLDPETWTLAQRADRLLAVLGADLEGSCSAETHEAALELSTGAHAT